MLIIDYTEFTRDITKAFKIALYDEVIINNSDGNKYKLVPVIENQSAEKSPLEDIPRIKLNITTQEIVEILHECRAGL